MQLPTDILISILEYLPFIETISFLDILPTDSGTKEKIRSTLYNKKIRHYIYSHREVYLIDGKRWRTDGPALIFPDGRKEYYINGQLHRLDGPALILPDGRKEYYKNGKKLKKSLNIQ